MKPLIVIDASVAASWVIEDEQSAAGQKLLESLKSDQFQPITVALFWDEFRNILVTSVRRGRLVAGTPLLRLQEIRKIGIQTRTMDDDALILNLATRYDLSAYDAAYLALALKHQSMLATNDRKLARAATRSGLVVRTALNTNLPT